jgi:hypothetical protein
MQGSQGDGALSRSSSLSACLAPLHRHPSDVVSLEVAVAVCPAESIARALTQTYGVQELLESGEVERDAAPADAVITAIFGIVAHGLGVTVRAIFNRLSIGAGMTMAYCGSRLVIPASA